MRTLVLTLFAFVSAGLSAAQQAPVLVGEYQGQPRDLEQIRKEVTSFLERLDSEPQAVRGAIALINGVKHVGVCVDNRVVEDESFERAVRAAISRKYRNRVTLVTSDLWT